MWENKKFDTETKLGSSRIGCALHTNVNDVGLAGMERVRAAYRRRRTDKLEYKGAMQKQVNAVAAELHEAQAQR